VSDVVSAVHTCLCLMSSVLYIRACVCCRQCCTYVPVSVVVSAVHTCLCLLSSVLYIHACVCCRQCCTYMPVPATDSHAYTQHTLSQTNILTTGDRFALVHARHTHCHRLIYLAPATDSHSYTQHTHTHTVTD